MSLNPSNQSLRLIISLISRFKRVTAWILHFVNNAHPSTRKMKGAITHPHTTASELVAAENYRISVAQYERFFDKIELLEANRAIPPKSRLLQFCPFLDTAKISHIGGRRDNSKLSYSKLNLSLHGSPPISWSLQDNQNRCSEMYNSQTSVTKPHEQLLAGFSIKHISTVLHHSGVPMYLL